MGIHLDEFLYRGRPEGSSEPPAWHVVLASVGENDFGEEVRSERTLNMAQAEAAGWALPGIIEAINADVLSEVDARRAEHADLTARLAAAAQALDTQSAALATAVQIAADLTAERDRLAEELAAMRAAPDAEPPPPAPDEA